MSEIIFLTGGRCEPIEDKAVKVFEDKDMVTYLCTNIIGYQRGEKLRYLESSSHSHWRTRNSFDLDLDNIDTDDCKLFILSSVSDWIYRLIEREPDNYDDEYFIKRVEVELLRLIKDVRDADGSFIIISRDVSRSVYPENKKERLEQVVIGAINCFIADIADTVAMYEFGIPRVIK